MRRPHKPVWTGSHLVAGSGRTFPQSRLNTAAIKRLFMASLAVRSLATMPLRSHQSQANALWARLLWMCVCVFKWVSDWGTHCLWSLPTDSSALNAMHLPVMKTPKRDQMMSLNSEWIKCIMFWKLALKLACSGQVIANLENNGIQVWSFRVCQRKH